MVHGYLPTFAQVVANLLSATHDGKVVGTEDMSTMAPTLDHCWLDTGAQGACPNTVRSVSPAIRAVVTS
jgi:hypothetical protein